MDIELEDVAPLRFPDGSPVRAASAVAPLGDGFLVVQDDATHGAWVRPDATTAVRLHDPVDGLDTFEESAGTKHLKPDLEAACALDVGGEPALLLMGSGSSPARTRWSLLRMDGGAPRVVTADMAPLYALVAQTLGVPEDVLNLEGACVVEGALRWFHRGLPSAGLPSGSVDLPVGDAVAAALGTAPPASVAVTDPRSYDLGEADGIGLAVTDAVALADGTILLSAAAEDSPDPRDDGPVTGSALVRLDGTGVRDAAALPTVDGRVTKVEGLMLLGDDPGGTRLLAVVDADDPQEPSLALRLRVRG